MLKSEKNKENDSFNRKGLSNAQKTAKQKAEVAEALKNPETKQKLMDFILGISDINPLENIRKGKQEELPNEE